ncbi:hypothetical protein HH216_12785 [Spirosoma rhododendri]|uniref:Uncharacterized protein n=2 Tax=Spirosoma rhododendri TaxID=2728024 RepID=A0A7L5DT91_9BACT|nr:hypothetical protein [Spirosoma rhododendri]QJD81355.1 hypothetical protein HH216_12785 [Spirosoma rhododendri]
MTQFSTAPAPQPPVAATPPVTDENWRKSIPAQVFLNHFFAMDYHIQHQQDLFDVAKFPIFQQFHGVPSEATIKAIEKLLLNSWSAEYALRITPVVNDEQYLQSSLHWTFPQAYYSALFSARAFLAIQGVNVSNEELIRKRIGNMVVRGYYPASIGYYALGPINSYRIQRLPMARRFTLAGKADLLLPSRQGSVQAELAQFLKTTRDQRVKTLRSVIQNNPKTALRSPKTGEVLQKFSVEQYKQLAKQIGYTTYFDMLSRLRISSTNREIERFVDSEIDVKLFHQSLVNIVSHVNAIHEAYIAKALGVDAYRQLVAKLPTYLQESFVRERMNTVIAPILANDEPAA